MLLERENVIMKKTRKIIMSLFAGICTAILIATSASATYNSTGKSFTNNEGGFFGIGATKYNYKVYKDDTSWYAMFHYLDVCPAIYHSKGKGATSLTYNCSRSYTGTTAYQFGASIGANVKISELVGLTATATGSQTKSYSYSVAASGDLIIAIGGGSVMDAAKLCCVLKDADYTIKDLLNDPTLAKKQIKTVMIPTTCGTGSEATCNAIVAVPEEQSKKGIVNDSMIPDYVVLDSNMIRKLPKSIVAATGVDALAHVVECFTSKKATPFSDTYAAAGAKLIFHNIREAYNNPDNMEAKSNMMTGAFYGGVAITGSGTTAVHALSYPLGGKYHIAHGVSNAILFAHVMEFNKDACSKRLAILCDAVYPELAGKSEDEKAQYMIDQIADIVKVTNIPTDLKEFGVKPEDLDFLVDAGSKQQRLLVNNMKELSLDDIRNIYLKVLK